jgi:hypothetical protein
VVYIRVYESTLETFAVMVEHIVLEVRNLQVEEPAATAKWRKKINWVVQVFNDMRENDDVESLVEPGGVFDGVTGLEREILSTVGLSCRQDCFV